MVLKGYLHVGASLCSLCGFSIFAAKAVFSMDACRLFPQHVLVIIPLIGVCRCGDCCLVLGFSVVVVQACPWSTRWEWRQLTTTPGVCKVGSSGSWTFLGSEGEVQGPTTTPGVWASGSGISRQPLEAVQAVSCPLRACAQGKSLQSVPSSSPRAPPKQLRLVSKRPRLPPSTPPATVALDSSPLSLSLHNQPQSSPQFWFPEAQVPAPSPCQHWWMCIRLGSAGWQQWPPVQLSLCSGYHKPAATLSSEALKLTFCPGRSPCQWGGFPWCRNLSSFTPPSQGLKSWPNSFLSFFSFFLPSYMEIFLIFQQSEVFCQHSVDILLELFHM